MARILLFSVLCLLSSCRPSGKQTATATNFHEGELIVSLIDPSKLATLGDRGANPRIQKVVAWLAIGKRLGREPGAQVDFAIERIGWNGTEKGRLTREAILRNLAIAESLGCTDPEDVEAMKRGRAPRVDVGPHKGEIMSVDHIIPRAVVPELDNVIANLEFLPLGANQRKGDAIGARQRNLAKELAAAGLLSPEGLARMP